MQIDAIIRAKRRSRLQAMLDDAKVAGIVIAEIIKEPNGSIRLITETRTYQQERSANDIDIEMKNAFGSGSLG